MLVAERSGGSITAIRGEETPRPGMCRPWALVRKSSMFGSMQNRGAVR